VDIKSFAECFQNFAQKSLNRSVIKINIVFQVSTFSAIFLNIQQTFFQPFKLQKSF